MEEGAVSGEYVCGVCVLYDDVGCSWYVSCNRGKRLMGLVPGDSLYDKKKDGEGAETRRREKERPLEDVIVMAEASAVVA